MNCNYKVKLDDIQNKYKFNIFCTGSYNDSDLRKMIESVFYALPRTTASGTSVTLTDTAFSYMKNKLGATDTTQPTTTGKNLLPVNSSFSWERYQLVELDNNISAGDYVMSWASASSSSTNASSRATFVYTDDTINSQDLWYDTTGKNITFSKDVNKIHFYSYGNYVNSEGITATFNNLMISSSGGEYEPYTNGASPNPDYPQTIHTITGNNKLLVRSKNLFNKNTALENKYVDNDTGNLGNAGYYASDYINIAGNEYISVSTQSGANWGAFYNKDKQYISGINSYANAISVPNNAVYVRLTILPTILDTFQVEKGSEKTTSKPYQSNAVLLTLGDTEICKIGNYEDKIFKAIKGNEIYDSLTTEEQATLDYGKWYKKEVIKKRKLDTSSTYNWKITSNVIYDDAYITDYKKDNSNDIFIMSNYFQGQASVTGSTSVLDNHCTFYGISGAYRIYFKPFDNLTDWDNFITNNNVYIYYVLATPTNEKFNDTIQEQLEDIYNNMLSYEGQTNISQENADLPFNIEATAIKDLNNL